MQGFLRTILPASWFAAVREGTKEWLVECKCGHKRDLWDLGGVRYKAAGEPRQLMPCSACHERTWHKVRKKTSEERATLGV